MERAMRDENEVPSLAALLERAGTLYRRSEYGAAMELLAQEGTAYPEALKELAYWRSCLSARLGRPEEAVGTLQQAVADGYWYSPWFLRHNEDLATLHGMPEFERLVDLCELRNRAAQSQAAACRLTVEPAGCLGPVPLLMALHGTGQNAKAEVGQWQQQSASGWLVSLPQSTQVWAPDRYAWEDRHLAAAEVRRHYGELVSQYAVDRERVVIGGFSRGAGLAVWLALTDQVPVKGFVAIAPAFYDVNELSASAKAKPPCRLRGYIIVGNQDDEAFAASQTLTEGLARAGIQCRLEVRLGLGRAYPKEFDRSLDSVLSFVLA